MAGEQDGLARQAIEANPELGGDPRKRGYESLLIRSVLPRLALALAVSLEFDLGPEAGGQHHDTHDALGVDAALAARHPHLASVTARDLGEFGRGACVQPELIADGHGGLDHAWLVGPGSGERSRRPG